MSLCDLYLPYRYASLIWFCVDVPHPGASDFEIVRCADASYPPNEPTQEHECPYEIDLDAEPLEEDPAPVVEFNTQLRAAPTCSVCDNLYRAEPKWLDYELSDGMFWEINDLGPYEEEAIVQFMLEHGLIPGQGFLVEMSALYSYDDYLGETDVDISWEIIDIEKKTLKESADWWESYLAARQLYRICLESGAFKECDL